MTSVSAIDAGTIAHGHDAGLLVPENTAASSATPTASASPACTSPHRSKSLSSTTASGTGTKARALGPRAWSPPAHKLDVLDVMRALAAGGMTMLVVTHEIGFAREVA